MNLSILFTTLLVILAFVITIIVYVIKIYNKLIYLRIVTEQEYGNLGATIKKKIDMLANLLKAVEEYAVHEKSTQTDVAKLRSLVKEAKTTGSLSIADNVLGKLFAVSERYPELRATENFQTLQTSINQIEGLVLEQKITYNQSLKTYNTETSIFPQNIVAKLLKFKNKKFYAEEEFKNENTK